MTPKRKRAASDRADRNFFRLVPRASPTIRLEWAATLSLQPLITSIESDESVDQIGREALAMQDRLVGTAPALESTVLRNLRHSGRPTHCIDTLSGFRERVLDTLSRQLESLGPTRPPAGRSPFVGRRGGDFSDDRYFELIGTGCRRGPAWLRGTFS